MDQSLFSSITDDDSNYLNKINEIPRDVSEIKDTDSIKNENLDATPVDVIYIKEEPLEAGNNSDTLIEMESFNPPKQEFSSLKVCYIVNALFKYNCCFIY